MTKQDLYRAAARAYCDTSFNYQHHADSAAAERHLEYDTRSTMEEEWLIVVVDAVVECQANEQ